jgi:3-deoxy-D-manno-octulosonate 8-phosphate phosphatase (KDO 8-P phosphatase)
MKKNIRYLLIDIDGTLTDGQLHYDRDGILYKSFNIKDGYGIKEILPLVGIEPVIITGGNSLINIKRSKDLGVKTIYQSVDDKLGLILSIFGGRLSSLAYIGDDINDLTSIKEIKKSGGITGCPSDAMIEVIRNCDFVSKHPGGFGAVRDFIDYLLSDK